MEAATIARSLRESMGDIVWGIDPKKDRVSDRLVMKQAAFNALQAEGVRVEFTTPDDALCSNPGSHPIDADICS